MPVTQYSYMSDEEFERELERRLNAEGQLILGSAIARELMERIRKWLDRIHRRV